MGYRGKLCIHPLQVPLANSAFVPSGEELEYALRLLASPTMRPSAEGVAAIEFEGQMGRRAPGGASAPGAGGRLGKRANEPAQSEGGEHMRQTAHREGGMKS